MYAINFSVTKKKFCLSLHYDGANSYLFVNGTEIYKFKAKDSEILATPLCLENTSKGWSADKSAKQDHKLLILMEISLCFFQLVLKQVNVVVVGIVSIIRMQKFVFLML